MKQTILLSLLASSMVTPVATLAQGSLVSPPVDSVVSLQQPAPSQPQELHVTPAEGPLPVAPANATTSGPWTVSARDYHSQVWTADTTATDPATGQMIHGQRSFVELASGLNYLDDNGQWQTTREEFQIMPTGEALARFGPHQLVVGPNLNAPDAVDFLTSDGVRLRSGPIGVGYYDPVNGNGLILGTVRDTPGVLTAPNEITFSHAFKGLDASVRITYRRAGMSADLILHEAPPDPALVGFSDRARLELYTEFMPDIPMPRLTANILRREQDPIVRQTMVEPDLVDQFLDFGQYKIANGTAFPSGVVLGSGENIPVVKTFQLVQGQPVLIEAIEWASARTLWAGLPPMKSDIQPLLLPELDEITQPVLQAATFPGARRRLNNSPLCNRPPIQESSLGLPWLWITPQSPEGQTARFMVM